MRKLRIFGMDFLSADDHQIVLEHLNSHGNTSDQELPFLITPNVDQVVKYHRVKNQDLFQRLRHAALILPDGQPIVTVSKWKFGAEGLKARLTGSDLFPMLWADLKKKQKKVLFVLPTEKLGKVFENEYPNCRFYAPPIFSVEDHNAYKLVTDNCLDMINEFKPDHVMIGLGFPKQEHLALTLHDLGSEASIFYHLLGASFEFYAGQKQRAPRWMQSMGLEFLHRMWTEPGRMIKRYLIDDLAFIPLVIKELRRPK